MRSPLALTLSVLAALLAAGCARARRTPGVWGPGPDGRPRPQLSQPAQAAPTSALRDGTTGAEADAAALERLVRASDVVAFGEYHDDPNGARFEDRLWTLVARAPDGRPGTLAMEFLERDVQAELDAYLAGTLAEDEFRKRARQGPGYAKAHGPLIERAKAAGRPVVAANAPRRLVTAYRKQDASYAEWRAALPAADQAALPRETRVIEDAYRERFMGLMGPERGAMIFKAQSLWDDAMAEAVADRRAAHAFERVLLVVGGFHVQGRLGTLTKYAARRPGDKVGLIVMAYGEDAALSLPADARGQADLVLVVAKPPPEPRVHPTPKPAASEPPAMPPVPAPKS